MNKENWDKFCQVFDLDVKVSVPKKVTRQDIILTLLSDGEIAFKSKKGSFILQINKHWDYKTLKTLVWNGIREFKEDLKDE
jgi:hypothetical protein